jgi:hypothetical protein
MPLYDETCRPWWRKIDFATVRHETALLSDEHELLYHRFLIIYVEHRCKLPADPAVLARALRTTEPKAKAFLSAAAHFVAVDDDGMLIHAASKDDFHRALRESIVQANRRSKRAKEADNA